MNADQPARLLPRRVPTMGALPVLLALLLTVLQAGMPFAHAMVHVFHAHGVAARSGDIRQPQWTASASAEKPCALCAEDQLSALPETHSSTATVFTWPSRFFSKPALAFSSAPLDVFCRPPPAV